jgi:hypothetical protein
MRGREKCWRAVEGDGMARKMGRARVMKGRWKIEGEGDSEGEGEADRRARKKGERGRREIGGGDMEGGESEGNIDGKTTESRGQGRCEVEGD